MKKFTNKFVAAVASLAMAGTLCVAGAVTMAGVAWGSPNNLQITPGPPAPAPWEKFAPTTGSITILKCDLAESTATVTVGSQPAAGTDNKTPSCPTGHKALQGAKFSLKKVSSITVGTGTDAKTTTLNLKSPESWQEIAKLATKLNDHTAKEDGTDAEVKFDGTNIADQTTGQDGKATFSNLGLGLYKVIETEPPAGYGISDLQSFYMTLPLPEYTTTGQGANKKTTVTYNYNPVVKPKNKNLSATIQKVYDKKSFAGVNDTLHYTITAGVNKAKVGKKDLTAKDLQGYMVFDDAPADALEAFKAAGEAGTATFADAVKSVKIGTTDLNKATSATDTNDYTVDLVNYSAGSTELKSKGLTTGHKRILVKFTDAGLGKIATALNGVQDGGTAPQVTVNLEFKVSSTYQAGNAPTNSTDSESNGKNEIVNASGFFPAHSDSEAALPPIIPNTEKSKSTLDFGYLQVHKYYMKDGAKTNLSGAEFKIFADKDKAEGCYKALNENKNIKNRNCKAASTFENATTDANGNFAKAYKTRAGDPVYLLEVKAPEGYARSTAVYEAKIEKDKTNTVEVEDLPLKGGEDGKSFWFNLPATGAYGVLIFAVVGMGLIVASVIMYVRNRKEEEQQNA